MPVGIETRLTVVCMSLVKVGVLVQCIGSVFKVLGCPDGPQAVHRSVMEEEIHILAGVQNKILKATDGTVADDVGAVLCFELFVIRCNV